MHVRARPLFAFFVASLSCVRRIAFWSTKSVEVLWRTHRAKTSAWIWMRMVAINILSYPEFPQASMHSLRFFCVAKEAWIRWQLSCYHVGFGSCDWVSCSKITESAWHVRQPWQSRNPSTRRPSFMVVITIVRWGYKPTNITFGGPKNCRYIMIYPNLSYLW